MNIVGNSPPNLQFSSTMSNFKNGVGNDGKKLSLLYQIDEATNSIKQTASGTRKNIEKFNPQERFLRKAAENSLERSLLQESKVNNSLARELGKT